MNKTLKPYHLFYFHFFVLYSSFIIGHSSFSQDNMNPPTLVPAGKPTVIQIPKSRDNSYTFKTSSGELRTINLAPPKTIPLAVLRNEKGEIIRPRPAIRKWLDGKVDSIPITDNRLHITSFILGEAGGYSYMQNYNTEQGLAISGLNRGACLDHFGNLWFGTNGGGVSRFDGKSFTNFTTAQGLANNMVFSIHEDKTGNIWFGTDGGGVSRFDGKSFTNFTTAQGLANNVVLSINEDKTGNIWFGTDGGGVSRFDPTNDGASGKSFTNFTTAQGLANNNVSSILEDKTGNLWFGTGEHGVSRFDPTNDGASGKSFTNFTTAQGLANNSVSSILEDKTGNIWFGTYGGGVSRFDGKSFTNFTTAQGLANNSVSSILEDKTGNIWFSTWGGVSRLSPAINDGAGGNSFTNFTTGQGLANNVVFSILEDKTGNIWFGTDGGGLSRYDGKSFANFTTGHGLANSSVRSILEDKTGNIWFGTNGGGVSRFDGKSFTNFTTEQGLANNSVRSILEDKDGNIWFGTEGGGVSHFNEKSFTNFTTMQGLANNVVLSILEDSAGNIWFGTNGGGVSRFDGKFFTNFTTAQGLGNNRVFSILKDKKGNLWFGTYGGGVSRFDGKSFTNFTTAQGLGNNSVRSILEDKKGNLWFGTYGGGVSRFDGKSFTNFTIAQGLPDNVVYDIVEYEQTLFFGTNLGLAGLKFSTTKLTENDDINFIPSVNNINNEILKKNYIPVWELFNNKTGYPIKDVNTNALFIDSKGIIWVGTADDKTSLVRFDYRAVHRNPDPPLVVIRSISIQEENVCWYNLTPYHRTSLSLKRRGDGDEVPDSATIVQQEIMTYGKVLQEEVRDSIRKKFAGTEFDNIAPFYPLPVNLVLPYRLNHVTFEYNAIEPARPYLVNYRYKLDGYDKEWSPVTKKTIAVYGNIHEGTYTFRLKAQSPDGVWSDPVPYTFKVLPPWYRTLWAYGGYGLFGCLLVWLIVFINSRLLVAVKRRLEDKVKIATAEITKQNELIEQKNKNITYSIRYAQRIQQAILPPVGVIKKHLPDSFILYKPKDIISGDFYFFDVVDEHILLSVADCTGHGVPGALLSMIGNDLLHEIITEKRLTTPSMVLNILDMRLAKVLNPQGKLFYIQDGMDIALISLKPQDLHNAPWNLEFSGANRPLVLIRNGKVTEYKTDRMPIGETSEKKVKFTNHSISLESGDMIYLFSDGYSDQFGGERNKKFMHRKFNELLLSISGKPMDEQKSILNKTIDDWKTGTDQTDDITVAGVRV